MWFFHAAFQRVVEFHRAHFDRLLADKFFAHFSGSICQLLGDPDSTAALPRRHVRHQVLVLKTCLRALEGGGHIEDRFAVLDALTRRALKLLPSQGFHRRKR